MFVPPHSHYKPFTKVVVETSLFSISLTKKAIFGFSKVEPAEVAAALTECYLSVETHTVEVNELEIVVVIEEYIPAGVVKMNDSLPVQSGCEFRKGLDMLLSLRKISIVLQLPESVGEC